MSFEGKVVLVTGASSGIGAVSAELFAQAKATVVLVGRNLEKLTNVEKKCRNANVTAGVLVIQADVTTDAEIIIEKTISKFGKLNVLVNNAGIFSMGNFTSTDVNELDSMMNTNLRAVHILTKLALPHLLKTMGNIVNVSSVAGITAAPQAFNYRLSKAALDQFTKCLALELAPKQVRVNSVNPAVIKTSLMENMGLPEAAIQNYQKQVASKHPIGRVGEPEEVAKAIVFLASDDASFITGAILPIDGGRSKAAV